jgi:hypothetical protein
MYVWGRLHVQGRQISGRARHKKKITDSYPFNCSRAARVTRFRGYAVSNTTGVNQTSPLDRHHPTKTLETVRFGVSNVPGGLLGPEISQVGGRPSWPSGVPGKATSGRAAHHARSSRLIMHASAAPVTKPDHDMPCKGRPLRLAQPR